MRAALFAIIIWSVSGTAAFGHPPENLYLQYDPEAKELIVSADHEITDKYRHAIGAVSIQINREIPETIYYHSQDKTHVFLKRYAISAEEGDALSVTLDCSVSGRLTGMLKLNPGNWNQDDGMYESTNDSPRRDFRDKPALDPHGFFYRHKFRKDNDKVPQDSAPNLPQNIQDTPKRRQMETEQSIQKDAYEARFGPIKNIR